MQRSLRNRKLKKRIRKLKNKMWSFDDVLAHRREIMELQNQIRPLAKEYDLLITVRLESRAEEPGIEIPRDNADWWYQNDLFGVAMPSLTEVGQIGDSENNLGREVQTEKEMGRITSADPVSSSRHSRDGDQ